MFELFNRVLWGGFSLYCLYVILPVVWKALQKRVWHARGYDLTRRFQPKRYWFAIIFFGVFTPLVLVIVLFAMLTAKSV